VFPGLKTETQDRLSHIAFETTDARQLRDYLASRSVSVPDSLKPDAEGNLGFKIKDADENVVTVAKCGKGRAADCPCLGAGVQDDNAR
jgi:hypothetical protein